MADDTNLDTSTQPQPQSNDGIWGKYLDLVLSALGGGAALKGAAAASKAIVPPVVGRYGTSVGAQNIPEMFKSALVRQGHDVGMGPGVGLNISRYYQPEQEGEKALSGGVFYALRGGDPRAHDFYQNNELWGGPDALSGTTWVNNPLFVHSNFGGLGSASLRHLLPEKEGKIYNDIYDIQRYTLQDRYPTSLVRSFLRQYAPGEHEVPPELLLRGPDEHRRLPFWLREAVVAHEARNRGYDSIINYNKPGDLFHDNQLRLNELFDVRENTYPSLGKYSMWPRVQRNPP
jgi:hypothetical protein